MGPPIKLEGARLRPRPRLDGGKAPSPGALGCVPRSCQGVCLVEQFEGEIPTQAKTRKRKARFPNSSQLVALL